MYWSYPILPFGTAIRVHMFSTTFIEIAVYTIRTNTAYLHPRPTKTLPACRRLLLPLLHAEKGRLRNAVANRVPASRWQGILFRINCEIISGWK